MLPREQTSQPTWQIATLFPNQGDWSEVEYLMLPTNRLVEFTDGRIEVLPMPSTYHQRILAFLFDVLRAYMRLTRLGDVLAAPLPVRLGSGSFREPDIAVMLAQNAARIRKQYWIGADLVMEIVSASDPDRDYVVKRSEYALAGIQEYWIVDPEKEQVTVLILAGSAYAEHGIFRGSDVATSVLLPGLSVSVEDILASQYRIGP